MATWFEKRKADGQFSRKGLILYMKETFADKQARQAALEHVNRMEQGESQFLVDFLLDFEYRIAQSGGDEAFTQLGRTMTLKAALNNKLRTALVGVKLPPQERHDDWVEGVKEVALELEGLANYRPRGATQITTRLGAPKSGVGQPFPSRQVIDAEGDVKMECTNAILAGLRNSVQGTKRYIGTRRAGNQSGGMSARRARET